MSHTAPPAAAALPGLTDAEVDERVRRGAVNEQPDQTSRRYRDIVAANVFTRFNFIVSVLAAAALLSGQPGDALFAGVMVVNTTIGTVQEIRAKRTLDGVRLLVVPLTTVRRGGADRRIEPERIVVDDVVVLSAGDQVVADMEVADSTGLEVDESALTGESLPVAKAAGDELRSGSIVVSGGAVAVVRRVGADTWIHRLVTQAKDFALASSELRSGVDAILTVVGWSIVPLTALLVWSQLRTDQTTTDAVVAAVAGSVALVPQGLVLLVSMALAVAVVRLTRHHVVVQELHAVEGLARVDVFCVDKTGTLTTGAMQLDAITVLRPGAPVDTALASCVAVDESPNPTMRVLAEHTRDAPTWSARTSVAFSSARKWSGAEFDVPVTTIPPTWILGAPDVLADRVDADARDAVDAAVEAGVRAGRRMLLLASATTALGDDAELPERLEPAAVIQLGERIRPTVPATLDYFARQGVDIRVISGDHPGTAGAIAHEVGLAGWERSLDMREIDTDDTERLDALVEQTTVFGRVLPEQKRAIIESLQRSGHRVAMTGDGVNDIPALKAADIGVAVDTAVPATKAVSQVVLLDGRFDRMPDVVAEGRRVVTNMERVSALFVTKTVYAALFVVTVAFSREIFPFLPRQMSLVSELTIGIPAFALSFRSASTPCRPGYLRRVVGFALPAGLWIGVTTLVVYTIARSELADASLEQARSVATLVLHVLAWWVLIELMRPLDRWDLALVAGLIAALIVLLVVPPTRDFYRIVWPTAAVGLAAAGVAAVAIGIAAVARRHRSFSVVGSPTSADDV